MVFPRQACRNIVPYERHTLGTTSDLVFEYPDSNVTSLEKVKDDTLKEIMRTDT
jgi:hypothetical protein